MRGFAGHFGDVLLVGNPISGRGKVARHLDAVAEWVRGLGLNVRVLRTGGPGDAREAAREFSGHIILVFGGDGTFNEVLNGADLDACVLGIIPAGTGNVLAKELGVPRHAPSAVRALGEGETRAFDLAVCNGRRFISVVGAGIDAHVVNLVHEARAGRLTHLHYLPPLLQLALRPVHWGVRVEVDGACLCEDADLVCVGNTHSYGGPIEMTPMAVPTDGLLDVVACRIRGMGDMIGPALGAILRSLHGLPSARYGRGRKVRLERGAREVPWQVDGDAGGWLPAQISCVPARVRIIVPRGSRPGNPTCGSSRGGGRSWARARPGG